MNENFQVYEDRHRFWTDTSLTQLSKTNNLLLTVSTGFLAFCFDKQTIKSIIINSTLSYNWPLFYYFSALTLIALSITLGIGILFCRLYGFRISSMVRFDRWAVGPSFIFWHINRSEQATSGGQSWVEPQNNTTELGLKANYLF